MHLGDFCMVKGKLKLLSYFHLRPKIVVNILVPPVIFVSKAHIIYGRGGSNLPPPCTKLYQWFQRWLTKLIYNILMSLK